MARTAGDYVRSTGAAQDLKFCRQAPRIYDSFVDVIFDHAVGKQILGPTTNPCPTFFSSPARGDVWNARNWGNYPDPNTVVNEIPAPARLVAVGDLHGDLKKTKSVLKVAALLGRDKWGQPRWTGGNSILVQVGDIFDRGSKELKICYLLEKLKRDAVRSGGAVHVLHGNHETLNMLGRFTYTTDGGLKEFNNWMLWWQIQENMRKLVDGCPLKKDYSIGMPDWNSDEAPAIMKDKDLEAKSNAIYAGLVARTFAMRPGGPVSKRFFGNSPTILIVGKSVFVHAGILPQVVPKGRKDVRRYNKKVSKWVKGLSGEKPPKVVRCKLKKTPILPVTWNRDFGSEDTKIPCDELGKTLAKLKTARMLIGHTIQRTRGLNAACHGRVIRLDVGMSRGCNDHSPQCLEILNDQDLRVLDEAKPPTQLAVDVDDNNPKKIFDDGQGQDREGQGQDDVQSGESLDSDDESQEASDSS